MNPLFTKAYKAAAALAPCRLVTLNADGEAAQASAPTNKLAGVTTSLPSAAGQHADVIRAGIANVQLGGAVSVDDEITSDAEGRGVRLAGSGQSVGRADADGVEGDIIPVFINQATISA